MAALVIEHSNADGEVSDSIQHILHHSQQMKLFQLMLTCQMQPVP